MEIENLGDQLFAEKELSVNVNFLAPKWSFRMLIIGPSGCGKSNLLMNLITKYLYYDKLFLYSKHLDQPLYTQFMNANVGNNC